eukprot:213427-Amorphochlora_amoeboformis.AAC.1
MAVYHPGNHKILVYASNVHAVYQPGNHTYTVYMHRKKAQWEYMTRHRHTGIFNSQGSTTCMNVYRPF